MRPDRTLESSATDAAAERESGRRFERLGQSVLKKSQDHTAGAQAFIEKRKPNWQDA